MVPHGTTRPNLTKCAFFLDRLFNIVALLVMRFSHGLPPPKPMFLPKTHVCTHEAPVHGHARTGFICIGRFLTSFALFQQWTVRPIALLPNSHPHFTKPCQTRKSHQKPLENLKTVKNRSLPPPGMPLRVLAGGLAPSPLYDDQKSGLCLGVYGWIPNKC